METSSLLDRFQNHVRELKTIESVVGLLHWDMQVMMPKGGGSSRSESISYLAQLGHQKLSDPQFSDLLNELSSRTLDPNTAHGVLNYQRAVSRATKVPESLVVELASAESTGFSAWQEARKNDDFESYAPHLERLVSLVRDKAAHIDSESHPYDVLLQEFEPGCSVSALKPLFNRLGSELSALVKATNQGEHPAGISGQFDPIAQAALSADVIKGLGYDLDRGRLDRSSHPFSVGISSGDCRITSRYEPDDLLAGLGATIHETGHALYEQGLPDAGRNFGWGEAASYGMHESQSRFWENFIGRSLPFCRWLAPLVQKHFPAQQLTAEQLFAEANRVEPSLIRVYADEVTYNLHIIVRFELELELMEGNLLVSELPEAWRQASHKFLGVTPENDAEGVLQDVHWSGGAFGYFPTYTLGNLYAASLSVGIVGDIPNLWTQVEAGEFGQVLDWLRRNVHQKGHSADAEDLVKAAVGDRDHVEDLMAHLWYRQGGLYGVQRT